MLTLPAKYRTVCTITAMVVMAAFAKDALPAFGTTTPVSAAKREPAPVVLQVRAPEAGPKMKMKMKTVRRITSGLASWYGKLLQGRPTASGQPYDMNKLTAAHRTLPFGSQVKVTDLRSKRSVVVTITDRGPVPEDRVIDLSLGAARELRMMGSGVAPVRLELLAFQN